MKVEIYSTPSCKYCNTAKDFFKANNIEYIEYNVAEDERRKLEAVELTGRMGVPVIRYKDDVFYGWDESNFRKVTGV